MTTSSAAGTAEGAASTVGIGLGIGEAFPSDVRVEINRSEPTERAELVLTDNGDRTCTILDDAGQYLYAIAQVPNENASGSLAHDAHTTSSTFTTTAPFTFNHTPTGTPWGVLVFIFNSDDSDINSSVTGVTYGGVDLAGLGGGGAGGVSLAAYYLASGVPSGVQTVSIAHDGNTDVKQAICITMQSGRDLQVPIFDPNDTAKLGSFLTVGSQFNPNAQLTSGRSALRYCAVISEHDNTTDLTALSGMTEIDSVDFGTEIFRVHRRTSAESGSQSIGYALPATFENMVFKAIAFEEIPFTSQLEIYDITDLDAPVLSGTFATLDNLVSNRARHAMAMDSTGDYLYVAGSVGTLYTLDISTRTSPSLVDTQVGVGGYAGRYSAEFLRVLGRQSEQYAHTVHVVSSQVFRASIAASGEISRYDISTPSAPSLTQTLSITFPPASNETNRSGVGYVTPDSLFIYYPWSNGTASAGITIVDIDGTMTEAATVTLPTTSSGGPQIHPLEIAFLPNPAALQNRFVTVLCRYRDTDSYGINASAYYYLWLIYQTSSANAWSDISLYSHDESGGVADPFLIGSALLSSGSAAGRLSVSDPHQHAKIVRAERGEDYLYLFLRQGGTANTLKGGVGFSREPSSQGRLTTWQFTNLGLDLDSSVGRTMPRLLSSMEPFDLHDCGDLHLVSGTLVGIGGNMAEDDRSLITLTDPDGWVELPGVLNDPGIDITLGLPGNSPSDRVAKAGTMGFELDNSQFASSGSIGQFSPDNANLFSGFRIGREVRLAVDYQTGTDYPWWGSISRITPSPGQFRDRRTRVNCLDFSDYLSRARAPGLHVRFDENAAQGTHLLLNRLHGDPVAVYFLNDSGDLDTYPVLFDSAKDEKGVVVSELQKLMLSERAFVYVVGGVFYFEGRDNRSDALDTPPDLVLDDSHLMELEVDHAGSNLVNEVEAVVQPRRYTSSPPEVLFTYSTVQSIAIGESVNFTATYRDPNQKAQRVGGYNMVTPVASTDYTFNAANDGTGADLTSYLYVSVSFGGNSAEVQITNLGISDGFLTKFQLRGTGIFTDESVTIRRSDLQSEAQFGPLQMTYDLPYHDSVPIAESAAQFILRRYGSPSTFVRSARIWGNSSFTVADFLIRGRIIGKLVKISETVTGISNTQYFVQNAKITYREKGLIYADLGLVPAATDSIFVFGGAGVGSLVGGDDVIGSSFSA